MPMSVVSGCPIASPVTVTSAGRKNSPTVAVRRQDGSRSMAENAAAARIARAAQKAPSPNTLVPIPSGSPPIMRACDQATQMTTAATATSATGM
jgi:hypothetical protein